MKIEFDVSALPGLSVYKELGDFSGTLKELKDNVESLIKLHGEHSYVNFDAGYNNIDCSLVTEEMIATHIKMLEEAEEKKKAQREAKALKKKAKKEKAKKDIVPTIYNLSFPTNPIHKGLVEIIDTYDNNYYVLAIDGQVIETTYKQSYEKAVLKRSFIKQCCEISGLNEEELSFVFINWEQFGDDNTPDYDCNDYLDDYHPYMNCITHYGPLPAKYIEFLATGITELEDRI